ncbi:histidine phosphatase family protein [Streptomyces aquilus]|uniref:Histidine phosphatase family protein n=1 Tax=Streptomyces aquilus TaxID=2548456 RepID=A0A3Q9C7Y6_9ACTN|nr:histidine phosphatase family protein [Streptomyces aquilus]
MATVGFVSSCRHAPRDHEKPFTRHWFRKLRSTDRGDPHERGEMMSDRAGPPHATDQPLSRSAPRTRVLFLRHCQSVDNAAGILSSEPPGAGLTDLGREQAEAALAGLRSEPVTAVCSSPARRAVETADIVAKGFTLDLPVQRDHGLTEYGVGVLERSSDAAAGRRSQDVLRRWIVDGDLDAKLPLGETGGSVVARFQASMERIVEAHAGGTVVVVTHVGTVTVGLVSLCADLSAERVWGRPLPHGTVVEVGVAAGEWSCPVWPTENPGGSSRPA